jgi:polyferredoxin
MTQIRTLRKRFDLLSLPLIGAFLRWPYARAALQIPLLLLALLAMYDGFTGNQIAPKNLATTATWLHYRGWVVVALALVGNLFCAACPLMLTRGPSKWLKKIFKKTFGAERNFPKIFKSKYPIIVITVLYLFAYEYFDLWSSPWLTAWLMVGYFAAALLADTFFPAGTFCKYLCPLGNFNFALSSVSPTQITAKDPKVCLTCEGKYCLNGRTETPQGRFTPLELARLEFESLTALPLLEDSVHTPKKSRPQSFPGCETKLYVPQISSNTDCTLCLNCLRACPHDNVALELRPASQSWLSSKPKPDWALLGILFLFGGMSNAFAMIEPFFNFATNLAKTLNLHNEAALLILMMVLVLGGGTLATLGILRLSSGMLGQNKQDKQAQHKQANGGIKTDLRLWGNVFFPLTFAVWSGHYSYHFMTGFLSIVPVLQNTLSSLGLWSGVPNWAMAGIIPENWLFPVQIAILYSGYGASLYIAFQIARTQRKIQAMIPLFIWLSICAVLVILILGQPMQMRGTLLNT